MLVTKKYTKNLKVAVCLFIAIAAIFLLGNFVLAGTSADLGLNYAAGTGLSNTQDIRITIAKIIRIALGFLGIIAISLIIYAGWLWMASAGNPEKIEQAKKILQNAVIGLIIILSAFAIVSFILNMLGNGSGGGRNRPGGGPGANYGLSALGNGIIESHYPARDQREVPRNTSIIITFREPMLASTLCTNPEAQLDNNGNVDNSKPLKCTGKDTDTTRKGNIKNEVMGIFKKIDEAKCINIGDNSPISSSACSSWTDAKVYSSSDNKIFVIVPINYLGSPSEYIDYTVYLGKGLKRQSGCLAADLLNNDSSKCDRAFPALDPDYGWSFQVSNKIDLTPPQVQKNGVFPSPDGLEGSDGAKDIRVSGGGQRAEGTITVNGVPSIDREARVVSADKQGENSPAAMIEAKDVNINKTCQREGYFVINAQNEQNDPSKPVIAILYRVDDQQHNTNLGNLGQGTFGVSGGKKQVVFTECNLTLTLPGATDIFKNGDLWLLRLSKATTADTVTLGDITYTATASSMESRPNFKVSSTDNIATAQSLRDVLRDPDVITGGAEKIARITAKVSGVAGNSINLSSSNSTALVISVMKNGEDQTSDVTHNGRTDQPMNSAIQINFNEAIMPLTVSGISDDVKDFIRVVNIGGSKHINAVCVENYECSSYKCEELAGNKKCAGNNGPKPSGQPCQADGECLSYKCDGTPTKVCVANELQGKFTVSNQYSTVEFLSDKECGFNACGEKIYCLPADSHLKVELNAASLISCADKQGKADNSLCVDKSPFNICETRADGKFCSYTENHITKYFPQAAKTYPNIVNGITDAAFNSLDGNRNGLAYGQGSYYNENAPATSEGDSFKWSFFISNVLDLIPPKITFTDPARNGSNVDLIKEITVKFDKLMLSSRLSTGSLTIRNGLKDILHYLLNLRSSIDQPLGYWVTNVGRTDNLGELISSDVSINHTSFSAIATYTAQAGSGLKDIYQNCFLPCDGPACSGTNKVDNQTPCCCNGTAATSCP